MKLTAESRWLARWLNSTAIRCKGAVSGFATGISQPVDIEVSKGGALYYLSRGAGSVGTIRYTGT